MSKSFFSKILFVLPLLSTLKADSSINIDISKLINKNYLSIDRGGNLNTIDAYSDGIGVFVLGDTDNKHFNNFTFKYGSAAKNVNAGILDYIINTPDLPAEDKVIAMNLKNNSAVLPSFDNSCLGGYGGDPYSGHISCYLDSGELSSGWLNLSSVNGSLQLIGPTFSNLNNLSNLNYVSGDLYFAYMNNMIDINTNINRVEGTILIQSDSIQGIYGINNLSYVGSLNISSSTLNIISGFNNLIEVNRNIDIMNTSNLTNISGFNKLNIINGNLFISQANNLIGLDGFNSLSSISGNLTILSSLKLKTISGFNNLSYLGSFQLQNGILEDLNFLTNITSIGYLYVDNNNIKNIYGLNKLKTAGQIMLQKNNNLNDLSPLNNLTSVNYVFFDNRSYSIKMNANSFLCQNSSKIYGTSKSNVCN